MIEFSDPHKFICDQPQRLSVLSLAKEFYRSSLSINHERTRPLKVIVATELGLNFWISRYDESRIARA